MFKGVFLKFLYEEGEFLFIIFLRFKKDGIYWMIFNLKKLNKFVVYYYFKMELLKYVISMMWLNCFMVFVDLRDVYYLVFIY